MKVLKRIVWGFTIFNVVLIAWQFILVELLEHAPVSEDVRKHFGMVLYAVFAYNSFFLMPTGILLAIATLILMLYKKYKFKINYVFLFAMNTVSIVFGWFMFQLL